MMTQPGWYPDPARADLERYWDGAQWTPSARPRWGAAHAQALVPERTVSAGALVVVLLGVAAVVISQLGVPWLRVPGGSQTFSAADLRADSTVPGFTSGYVTWVAWLLLVVVGALAVLACLPLAQRAGCRAAGAVLAVGAAVVVIGAVGDMSSASRIGFWEFIREATSFGPYLALFGFLVIGVGAAASGRSD